MVLSMSKKNAMPEPNRPHCGNCDFYVKKHNGEGDCTRYDFVMPTIGWYTICSKWQSQGQSIDLSDLKDRKLYYYSQAQQQVLYAELAGFQELRHKVISVSIRQDAEHGWVIYPRKQYRYFPNTGQFINILVGERNSKFEVINEERKLAFELIPIQKQAWERQDHLQYVFMLASVESPELLYDWYNHFIDVDVYAKTETVSPSLHAFLVINEQDGEYRLLADLLNYQKYMR